MGEYVQLSLHPITFRDACAFIKTHHRHHKPPRGMKFCVSVRTRSGDLVGVGTAGRPVARADQEDPFTLEINRTCTEGTKNSNSMIYGALRRAAWALGYNHLITFTEESESGVSLVASGFTMTKVLPPRANWAESSVKLRDIRDPDGRGGVTRFRWECWKA